VTAVLLEQFAGSMQQRIDAVSKGLDPNAIVTKPASGLSIVARAARLALMRVFRRFFLPYQPQPTGR
jgi:16S rRNA G966 N2-methylase RsmD